MLDIDLISEDSVKTEDGVWLDFDKESGASVKIRAASSDYFRNARVAAMEAAKDHLPAHLRSRWNMAAARGDAIEDFLKANDRKLHEEANIRAAAALVSDWDGFSVKGEPLLFSRENAIMLMKRSRAFALFVNTSAVKDVEFLQQAENAQDEATVGKQLTT